MRWWWSGVSLLLLPLFATLLLFVIIGERWSVRGVRERVRGVDESNVDEIYTVHQRQVYVFSIRNKRLRVCERAFEAFRTFSGSLSHLPEGWVSNDGTRTSSSALHRFLELRRRRNCFTPRRSR